MHFAGCCGLVLFAVIGVIVDVDSLSHIGLIVGVQALRVSTPLDEVTFVGDIGEGDGEDDSRGACFENPEAIIIEADVDGILELGEDVEVVIEFAGNPGIGGVDEVIRVTAEEGRNEFSISDGEDFPTLYDWDGVVELMGEAHWTRPLAGGELSPIHDIV